MKFTSSVILAGLVLAFPLVSHGKLNVIATTGDFGAIAREVGGDEVKVTVLARPTEDPHFVDAKPSFLVQMSHADLLIEGGAELEAAWLSPLIDGSRNPKIQRGAPGHFMANEGVQILEVPTALDRSQGDIHAAGNPHYLTDPVNAQIIARNIAKKLCELDPRACQKFEKNEQSFNARIDAKLKEWDQKLAPYKGQHIASYHNSWPYFAKRFGFVLDLFLEPRPGIPPTPAHLAEVIAAMQQEHVKVILCEPFLNRRTAEKVAADTGATVIDSSQFPGGIKGVKDDYISLIDHLVNAVAAAMSKP
ncbi:MAG TPA: metal ABC transporter substrate-binding protein [Verrucomicrobiae bacterium]|jgi:ABC-type Zn uptake system ZnuABC Zn-binding protein ZnuA|nr:metal ABC transporter substrate-binding protein [Verrucomicrobiae bacterium]